MKEDNAGVGYVVLFHVWVGEPVWEVSHPTVFQIHLASGEQRK